MESTTDIDLMMGLGLESNLSTATTDKVFYFHRGIKDATAMSPILVFIHGYPQSSFMWRHIVPLLPHHIPLFIPDVPGYGRSQPLHGPHDKRSVGSTILASLRSLLANINKQPIILIGHDRGARICHRLAVDSINASMFIIRGIVLLDIVPTLVQFQTFSNPATSVGSFHWPFLANVEIATKMIMAQGGDVWTKMCLDRWVGKNPVGLARFCENGAVDIYAGFFRKEEVVRATCDDYRAGAQEDVLLQEEDQRAGRKVDVDVLAIYSADYLGKRYDVRKVWEEWMGKGTLEVEGLGNGLGHFIAEEAPEKTTAAILKFYEKHV